MVSIYSFPCTPLITAASFTVGKRHGRKKMLGRISKCLTMPKNQTKPKHMVLLKHTWHPKKLLTTTEATATIAKALGNLGVAEYIKCICMIAQRRKRLKMMNATPIFHPLKNTRCKTRHFYSFLSLLSVLQGTKVIHSQRDLGNGSEI